MANQADLTLLTELIDRTLERSPFYVGQPSGSSVRRVLKVSPLGISYDIVEDDKKVIVKKVIVQACWLVGES